MDAKKVIAEAFQVALEESGLLERLQKVEEKVEILQESIRKKDKVEAIEREVMESLITEQVGQMRELAETGITTIQGRLDLVEAEQAEIRQEVYRLGESFKSDLGVLRSGLADLVMTLQNAGILELKEVEGEGGSQLVGQVHPVVEHLVKLTELFAQLERKYDELVRMLEDKGTLLSQEQAAEEPVPEVKPGEEHPAKSDMEKVEEEVEMEEEGEEEELEEELPEEEEKEEEMGVEEEEKKGEEEKEEEEAEAKMKEKGEKMEGKIETVDQIFEFLNKLSVN